MDVIASTRSGKVEGIEKDGVLQFRGVPYAAPPIGPRRFRAPQPVEPWSDVRSCRDFGPIAPQNPGSMERLLGAGSIPADEDCLFLNVFTPGLDDAGRPVMMWIHGGGFTSGAGSVPWYSGARLASKRDVVVVTINYRLGVLGFTHLAGALGDEFAGSGNAGILDQVAALEWVRDNIAGFGGDPSRVTIFGESAGGMSVGTLLAVPAASGLFSAAIAQSGAAHNAMPADSAAHVTEQVLAHLGAGAGGAEAILDAPVAGILAAQETAGQAVLASRTVPGSGLLPFQPVVDGTVLREPPLDSIAAGSSSGVALVAGTTRDEWNLFHLLARANGALGDDDLLRRCERAFAPVHGPGAGERALDAYRRAARPGASPDDVWVALETDRVFRMPAIRMAEAHAAHTPETYMYNFMWASTAFGGALGACHAIEIPFAFDNLHRRGVEMFLGAIDEGARQLAAATSGAWAAFAHDHSPRADGLPEWPRYEPARRATMHLGDTCAVVDDPGAELRALWEGVI